MQSDEELFVDDLLDQWLDSMEARRRKHRLSDCLCSCAGASGAASPGNLTQTPTQIRVFDDPAN